MPLTSIHKEGVTQVAGTKQEFSNLFVKMEILQNMSSYEEMVNPDFSLQDTDIFAINSPSENNDLVFC